ncbi:MAG TPA: O-antigen ligase family protein, partial [Candidatus Dormibacteraeota bacterium]|nr:O-antigen ligase family protein [Candidatus Dormibacteraeota bacterium]
PAATLSGVRFAGLVAAVVFASWVPVLVGTTTRAAAGWVVAVAIAAGIAWLLRRLSLTVLVGGFVLSSALVPSGLVTESTHYMPVAVTGGALALRLALVARRDGLPRVPVMPIAVSVGLYLAWAAVTTVTSIDRRTSLVYLVGLVAVCGLAFWLVPASLTTAPDRDRLLAALGALGVAVAVSVYAVSMFGGFVLFGRTVGFYREVALTVGGATTALHFGYSSGAYITPLEPSVLMAVGVLALLGWSSTRSGRDRIGGWLAIAFMAPAILLTLDRSAQLAVIAGAGAFTVLAYATKARPGAALPVCVFFAVVFLLVFVNALGAVAVTSGCTANCSTSNPQDTIRGGTGLSGREFLWKASIEAVKHRPVFGYGAGNNVPAIAPYLGQDAVRAGYSLGGLTSHSTWFRTAVELGIPGLALLLAVLLAVAWLFLRRFSGTGERPDATLIALAAIVAGLVPAMTFETFLLGGVTFSSLVLTVAAGLLVPPEGRRIAKGMLPG